MYSIKQFWQDEAFNVPTVINCILTSIYLFKIHYLKTAFNLVKTLLKTYLIASTLYFNSTRNIEIAISFFRVNMQNQDDVHYVECDNCEQEAAHYHCKTCYGHLCKDCKMTHESKRLTRGHSLILLSEYSRGTNIKQDQCTCEIRRKLKEEMETIENYWLPFLKQSQEEEYGKKKSLSENVRHVKHEMEEQYGKLVKRFTDLKNKAIAQLEEEEGQASIAIDKTIEEMKNTVCLLDCRVKKLKDYLEDDENLPKNMCNEINKESISVKRFTYIRVDPFCPGNLDTCCLQQVFGYLPTVTLKQMK